MKPNIKLQMSIHFFTSGFRRYSRVEYYISKIKRKSAISPTLRGEQHFLKIWMNYANEDMHKKRVNAEMMADRVKRKRETCCSNPSCGQKQD